MADLEDIRGRLEAISEELADVALDRLRAALASGGQAKDERIVTRARRSVDRAVHLLGPLSGGEPSDYDDDPAEGSD